MHELFHTYYSSDSDILKAECQEMTFTIIGKKRKRFCQISKLSDLERLLSSNVTAGRQASIQYWYNKTLGGFNDKQIDVKIFFKENLDFLREVFALSTAESRFPKG